MLKKEEPLLRRVDFENGRIIETIVQSAFPMLIAQLLNLLYNVVDRVYIARILKLVPRRLAAWGFASR